ncbi:hypothetical protein MIR68_012071 [Amoeboaphelidium protococcarum]|nr:hypothetical protein MIR68_012071 [Amoeboaphelidium protococcarum]
MSSISFAQVVLLVKALSQILRWSFREFPSEGQVRSDLRSDQRCQHGHHQSSIYTCSIMYNDLPTVLYPDSIQRSSHMCQSGDTNQGVAVLRLVSVVVSWGKALLGIGVLPTM